MREREFIERVRDRVAATEPTSAGIRVGLGDDAAVIARDVHEPGTVVTTDMLIEGVDFRVSECGFRLAGAKAIKKSLSDLAAMGVRAHSCYVAVALPVGIKDREVSELVEGLVDTAASYEAPIAGGDTKRSPHGLIISVTAIGREGERGAVLRSGARTGHTILVTGVLGGAPFGSRHLDFEPRLAAGLRLNETHRVTSMIDLSDGLSTDLRHLAAASGVGASVDAERLPISQAAREAAAKDGRNPIDHALSDGEDYELLFTAEPTAVEGIIADRSLGVSAAVIGVVGEPGGPLELRFGDRTAPLDDAGFEHSFDRGEDR